MVMVIWPPLRELYLLRQSLHLLVGQDDELLVGGRVKIELVASQQEHLLHLHGFLDGVTRQLEVKVVSEQGLKLKTYQSPLGYYCTMLLLDREEVLMGIAVSEYDGLAAQRANLGASDIKHITVTGQIR